MWGSVAICAVSRGHHSTMQAAMCCSNVYGHRQYVCTPEATQILATTHVCRAVEAASQLIGHREPAAQREPTKVQRYIGPTMRMQMVGRHSVFLHYCYNLTTTSLFGSVMHAHRVPYVPDHECGVLLARFTSTRLAVRGGCFCFRGPGPRPQTGRGGSTD